MKIIVASFGLIFLLLIAKESIAQEQQLKFDLIKGSNGVSIGKINCIIQDKYGFIWLSDQDNHCIVRYDGNTMVRFQNNPKDSNSLGGFYPECLYADSSGNIWIGFWGMGLDKFDPETKKFTHYRHQKNNPESLSSDTVSCIRKDHLGNLWLGTNGGLDLLDQKTGKFKHYQNKANDTTSLSCNIVRSLYEDHAGVLWVGTGMFFLSPDQGGLNRFNREKGNFTRYRNDPKNPNTIIDNRVRSIFEDSKGNFWIGTSSDGLHIMDRKKGTFTRFPYNPKNPEQLSRPPLAARIDHITFITEDAEKKIWIGAMFNGINRYDPDTKKITHYGNDADKTGSFKDNSAWWAYPSTDGQVWISTQASNLYKVDLYNFTIPHYGKKNSDATLCFLEEPPAVFWLGTVNGLIRKDGTNGTIKKYQHDPGNPNSLINNVVTKIIKSKKGELWIGTNGGLERFDPNTQKFTHYFHNPSDSTSLANNFVTGVLEDRDLNIWVGTGGSGIDMLDTKTGKFTRYRNKLLEMDPFSLNISAIFEDETTDLWIGNYANSGMKRLNRQTGKFKQYLPGLNIYDIHKDASGIIWVSTGNGLFKYNRESDNFSFLAEGNPELEMNNTGSIVSDDKNNLWIGANNSLYTLNPGRNHLVYYDLHNGVSDEPGMIDGSAYKRQDGSLYFGDVYGYYFFYPDKLKAAPGKTRLYFSNFWVANEAVKTDKDGPLKKSIFDAKEIALTYKQDIFSLSFSAIDFRNRATQKIFYRLEGFDNAWRQANPEDRIQYFKVPPGKYSFHIKTTDNNNGELVEKSIAVMIAPPWYTSWWAYCIYGLLFIAFVFSVDRYQKSRILKAERERTRVKELAQAKEIEKAYHELKVAQSQLIQSEKMASLGELTAGIAHEIQNPLNFVNNFSEVNKELLAEMNQEMAKGNYADAEAIARNVMDNEDKINHHGKRADAIVKGMLQHSQSVGGIKEPTNINALADEYLRLAYHGLKAKDKSFNASMKTDFDPQIGSVSIVPQDIGRVFLNLINNAFYAVNEKKNVAPPGYEPTVWLKTKRVDDKVEISIRDNGNGIPEKIKEKIFQPFFTTKPTGQGTGLGLSLSYDIVKAHGGELRVETKEGEGSEFMIQLPGRIEGFDELAG